MLGILLTLPEGEPLGGRWECELRGRFGPRILPQVVPFDEEVGKALLLGQILRLYNPESVAAQQYLALTETLSLASTAAESVILSSQAPLAALTASYQASGVMARVSAGAVSSAGATAAVAAPPLGRERDDELGCSSAEGPSTRNGRDDPQHARDTVHDELPGMAEEPDLPLANELPDLELTVPEQFAPQLAAAPDSVPDIESVFNPPPPPRLAPPRRPSAGPGAPRPTSLRQTGKPHGAAASTASGGDEPDSVDDLGGPGHGGRRGTAVRQIAGVHAAGRGRVSRGRGHGPGAPDRPQPRGATPACAACAALPAGPWKSGRPVQRRHLVAITRAREKGPRPRLANLANRAAAARRDPGSH